MKQEEQSLLEKEKEFYEFHKEQLEELPSSLQSNLYHKLSNNIQDYSEYFNVQDNQNDDTFQVIALKHIPKGSQGLDLLHNIIHQYQHNVNQNKEEENEIVNSKNRTKNNQKKIEDIKNGFNRYFKFKKKKKWKKFLNLLKRNIKSVRQYSQDIIKNVFIVEHQLTFKSDELRGILMKDRDLVNTLKYQLQYFTTPKIIPGLETPQSKYKYVEEFDSLDIVDPSTYKIDKNTVSVSFFDNKIADIELVRLMLKELPNLKSLFLNYNPVSDIPNFRNIIESEFPSIELLNSKLTANASDFGLKFSSYKYNLEKTNKIKTDMIKSLDLSNREVLNLKNFEIFKNFKNLTTLDLTGNKFTNEENKERLYELLNNCPKLQHLRIEAEIEEQLWDMYENKTIQQYLPQLKQLERINDHYLNYIKPIDNEQDIKLITNSIYRCIGQYSSIKTKHIPGQSPIQFLNHFQALAIQHSDHPNLRMIPFQYSPTNKIDGEIKSYSIFWSTYDIEVNELVYRDYLQGIDENHQRSARLAAWYQVPETYFASCLQEYKNKLMQSTLLGRNILKTFQSNLATKEQPNQQKEQKKDKLKVLTDSPLVKQQLNLEEMQLIENVEEADIVFLIYDTQNQLKNLIKNHIVNQFPYEQCIVHKSHLAQTVYTTLGQVDWLEQTYNLETELSEFIGEYNRRNNLNEDNVWIIKAFDLARSMDMIVTDNLPQIIRSIETLPRLAQKYISKPLTLFNKKIDLRFIVAVKSIKPLQVYVCKNFLVRTSNNDFTNDYRSNENYETHFTVMNYGGKKLTEILQDQFIQQFEIENNNIKWDTVQSKIINMVKQLFIAVANKYPQMHSVNSRAVYGMDVMIERGSYQPKLLEMTYSPDATRNCKYNPLFYNELFSLLFLNKENVESFVPVF